MYPAPVMMMNTRAISFDVENTIPILVPSFVLLQLRTAYKPGRQERMKDSTQERRDARAKKGKWVVLSAGIICVRRSPQNT